MLLFLMVACGPGDHASTSSGLADVSSTTAIMSTSSSTDEGSSNATTSDVEATSAADTGQGSAQTGDAGEPSSGSSTGLPPGEDPYALCAMASTQRECESIDVEARSNQHLPSPSCQWRDVYTVDASPCMLESIAPRCILYFGNRLGCGGLGCTAPDTAGPKLIRDIGGSTELIFYPMDDICGPWPEAPPDEPPWIDCDEPSHPACECICGLLE